MCLDGSGRMTPLQRKYPKQRHLYVVLATCGTDAVPPAPAGYPSQRTVEHLGNPVDIKGGDEAQQRSGSITTFDELRTEQLRKNLGRGAASAALCAFLIYIYIRELQIKAGWTYSTSPERGPRRSSRERLGFVRI